MPKIFGTCAFTIPGPLSSMTTTKRPSPFVRSPSPFALSARSRTSIVISGRMPASSQASSELSTASLMVVRSAFDGLSNPSRCRFFVKNSEIEISRCCVAICSAVARRFGPFSRSGAVGGRSSGAGSSASSAAGGARRVAFPFPFGGAGAGAATFAFAPFPAEPPGDPPRAGRPASGRAARGLGVDSTGTSSSCFAALPSGFCAFGPGFACARGAGLALLFTATAFRPIGS